MIQEEYMELTERYLDGTLEGEEQHDFEERLKTNPELLEFLLGQKQLREKLLAYAHRKNLKSRLDKIHSEMMLERSNRYTLKRFWNDHARTIGVAASVSFIVVLSSLFWINMNNVQKKQSANFKAMRKDIDKIKNNQKAIIRNLNTIEKKETVRPANFSGTGFAVSVNGFFITSLHVIQDADSVFVRNTGGLRYKAVPVYRDPENDLAILKIESENFTPLEKLPYTFNLNEVSLGEKVFTLGYPKDDVVYGEGTLSSISGYQGDTASYQISIPVNPGSSGSPLFDNQGNVIGLISGIESETQSTTFALKSRRILHKIEEIQKDSLTEDFKLPRKNIIQKLSRVDQVKAIKDCIVNIEVYNTRSGS